MIRFSKRPPPPLGMRPGSADEAADGRAKKPLFSDVGVPGVETFEVIM